jgi:hypothetical protein
MDDKWCFDSAWMDAAGCKCIEGIILSRLLSGFVVETNHLDTTPMTSENEPGYTVNIEYEIGINGIVKVCRIRFDNDTLIDPLIIVRTMMQCFICG